MKNGKIPPSLHFEQPNPHIDLAASPFFINTELIDWPASAIPRRAGVSAFGFGGTNFHTVLEEAPSHGSASARRSVELFAFRAAKREDLAQKLETLVAKLAAAPEQIAGAQLLQNGIVIRGQNGGGDEPQAVPGIVVFNRANVATSPSTRWP